MLQADVARAGEGDHGDVGMFDQRRADLLADAGQEIDHARRQADLLEDLHQLGADDARLLGRLHDDGVAGDEGGRGHAAQDGHREVPRRDDDRDAARLVEVDVLLAGGVAPARLRPVAAFRGRKTRNNRCSRPRRRRPRATACRIRRPATRPTRNAAAASPAPRRTGTAPASPVRVAPLGESRRGRLDGLPRLLRRGGAAHCRRSAGDATG